MGHALSSLYSKEDNSAQLDTSIAFLTFFKKGFSNDLHLSRASGLAGTRGLGLCACMQ